MNATRYIEIANFLAKRGQSLETHSASGNLRIVTGYSIVDDETDEIVDGIENVSEEEMLAYWNAQRGENH